ncbi:hypothetical protein [Dysgonomonas sp. GY617]|uniref:hypothetical protein n=1 Tax=Dysgonomonas sp. GY617 TaxID=2780420 RepID=UPI001883DD35|nr:hypothetical protein [Dysgonomonas sp. GY617]MBF0578180.1 hypothetical protein [Dysgonomonas sp. GY617]
MSLLIGKKTTSGIRYISVEYAMKFTTVVHTLKTFYKTVEKVDALIDLGNLNYLGKTPYKKCKGEQDLINCESKIRDRKLSPGKHGASTAKDESDFLKKLERECRGLNCCFLFDEGKWYVLVGGHKEQIESIDESVLDKSKRMDGLTVFNYKQDDSYNKLIPVDFYSWNEVLQSANTTHTTYYIFRGERFLSIITPGLKLI